jgi:lipopolysaccharide/colanic/teichoic acid biosynthesis glycosyltransferase
VTVKIKLPPKDSDLLLVESQAKTRSTRNARALNEPAVNSPVLELQHRWYQPIKTALEWVFALALLVVVAPLIGVLALLVKLTSRGPVFYKQRRVGQYGRHFTIVKLRTMVDNCESLTGPRWSIPGDPRVTRLGHFLRVSHLDELPQLINVLRGDMGIIGPRPERPEFLPKLELSLPGYRNRLLLRPGVTGLAQVQLPADTDLESVRRKLLYDLYYVQWASPWLDLSILCCTVLHVLGVPFWLAGKLLRVPGSKVVEEGEPHRLAEPALPRPRIAA